MNALNLNESQKAIEKMIKILETFKNSDEEIARKLFGNLDDAAFGEVYNTVCNFDQPMRSCVYFIKNEYNGLIKIGKTEDFPRRLQQIKSWFYQCGLDPKLKVVMIHATFPKFLTQLEGYYHKQFKDKRKYGEWFEVNENLLTDWNNFGDGFVSINETLVCFEEYENLTLKKDQIKYGLDFYLDQIKDIEVKAYFKNILGIPNTLETVIFKHNNNTQFLLHEIIKKDACVMALNGPSFIKIGRIDAEPVSFSELKRSKFYDDYSYWEHLLTVQE